MGKSPLTISSKEHFASILKSSRLVVADFWAEWCGPCKQIAPHFESLSQSLSRDNVVTFVKVNNDNQPDLARQYQVTALPTFLIFRDGQVVQKVQGASPRELQTSLRRLVTELETVDGSSSGSGSDWQGAEVPRGYSDITDQIEIRNCELLNADEDAGPVKVLFTNSKPSGLDGAKSSSKDWVQSGADDQLLLFIPFQSTIKLHTLQITSLPPAEDDAPSRPETIQLYLNRPQNIDFDEADETEPTQLINLTKDDWNTNGTANISLRYVKFQKTSTLIVYVQRGADGAETVRLDRVKLIGEAGTKREMGKLQKVGEEE